MSHALTTRGRAELVRQAIEQIERNLEYFELNQLLAEKNDDDPFPGGEEDHTYASERAGFQEKLDAIERKYAHLMPAVRAITRLQQDREEKATDAEIAELDKQEGDTDAADGAETADADGAAAPDAAA